MYIVLTRKYKKLTPEIKERIKEFRESYSEPKSEVGESGLPLEWYKEQNLRPPSELEQEDNSEFKIDIERDTVDAVSKFLCNTSLVESFEELEEGTTITYDTGREVLVEEQLETILKKIKNG